ncbi:dipeptidase [Flammeovirga sp. SJP92]|uniref:dipeptidase n=1 Tax=Flammeovirga sp. SJP92 TaxID=1775430 RepID=UPI0007880A36|nr:dipeptidase [Flammeovirga sp. SJP92]KXX72329.1 peptidase dimerization domain protein [Flammeovirga sp. SJP92]
MTKYIEENKDRFLSELFDLLRIPSVSTDVEYQPDIKKAAAFIAHKLTEAGADKVEICPTKGNPVVYGEKIIDSSLPTVIVYGHYDVQPADPLDLWDTPPFEPTIKNDSIYARGASDDKGQMYMHIKAFESMMKNNTLACNVKFMLEGEEEIGSVNLGDFIRERKEDLKADVILISDTGMISVDTPSITVGLRGLSYMELELTGPNRDLHSGMYGGAVQNPLNALSEVLAALKDKDGHITIPGFYDKVEVLTEEERAKMAKAPFDLDAYKKALDIDKEFGEKGFSTNERTSIRPTLDINGMWGGYIGEGAKTVIPSKAYAKVSMRLVPHQSWEEISDLFAKHVESLVPDGIKVKVTAHHGGTPVVIPTNSTEYQAANDAYAEAFGKEPIPVRSGGSIPIVALFKEELGLDSVMMGFGLDSDAIHSPNEKFGIFNFLKGIETIELFYKHYAKLKK